MTKTDNPKVVPFDPWAFLSPRIQPHERAALPPAEKPPQDWERLNPDQRALLGGLAYSVVALYGPFRRDQLLYLVARFYEALAATWTLTTKGSFGHDLTQLFERDDDTRARWRALGLTIQGPGVSGYLLRELLEGISALGDLEATLLARRAAIDQQLERIRGAKRAAA